MTNETYNFWSLIFNFFTAVGTVSAVIVALRLASSRDAPRIKVTCGIRFLINHGDEESLSQVHVQALNVGIRSEKVQSSGYTIGLFKWKVSCFVMPSQAPQLLGFPCTLESGETAYDVIDMETFNDRQLEFFTKFFDEVELPDWIKNKKWFPKYALKTARCWVSVTRGSTTETALDKHFQEYILEQWQEGKKDELSEN